MGKQILALSTILMLSCTTYRQFKNEKIEAKIGCSEFTVENNRILTAIKIENQLQTLVFDTGAMASLVTDSTFIKDFSKREFGKLKDVYSGDHIKIENKTIAVKIKNNLFSSENKIFRYFEIPKSECTAKKTDGLIGIDCFFTDKHPLQIDFKNNQICYLSETETINHLKNSNYHSVKSQCKFNIIYLFITVDGIEYKFRMDTGFTANLIMPASNKHSFSKFNSISYEGSMFKSTSGLTNGKETFIENVELNVGGDAVPSKIIVSTSVKEQIIGMGIIKGFDWIIDYNNNKVYARINGLEIENLFRRKTEYIVNANQGKLKIIVKEQSQAQYNLGDQIIAVNGEKVTSANRCELQDLLNKTEDWSTLNLEVIPGIKS